MPRRTGATSTVLEALARAPRTWRHGYSLLEETGLQSGTLYPILRRLSERGLLSATWEEPTVEGRPPRHLYRLTADGLAEAKALRAPNGVALRFT